MEFNRWLDTLVLEKELDTDQVFEVEGESGANFILLGCVVDAIKNTSRFEQVRIKDALVWLDFHNGDVSDYFRHLSQALAI